MLENNIHIDEYRKSKDENRVEDIFAKLKVNCKEVECKFILYLKYNNKNDVNDFILIYLYF